MFTIYHVFISFYFQYAALQGAPRYVSLRAFTGAADIGIDKTSTAFGYKAMINDKCQAQVREV